MTRFPTPAITRPSGPPGHAVLRVVWITLVLNVISASLKLAVGFWTRNLTVISDAVHGYLDASNNVIGLVGLRMAWRPPDENHPYGHRKFEALAAMTVGLIMTLTSWEILKATVRHFFGERTNPAEPPTALEVGLVALGLVANVVISTYEARKGREYNSPFLLADAAHTRSDILVTVLSISSLLLAPRLHWLDSVLSCVVVCFILVIGWQVLRDNVLFLTDAVQMDPEPIRRVVEGTEGVVNAHAIRTHGMPDDIHLDLHIVVSPAITAAETNQIERRVREAVHGTFPQIAEVAIHHQTEMPRTAQPLRRKEGE